VTEWSAGSIAFPAMMLAGYMIEDLAKARILELGEGWGRSRGHDLPWLVAKAGIDVDAGGRTPRTAQADRDVSRPLPRATQAAARSDALARTRHRLRLQNDRSAAQAATRTGRESGP
jgi:hypothetical protein